MELPKIPRELEEAVRENELIIFAGAGLTYNLLNVKGQQIEGWKNLVRHILLHLKDEGFNIDVLLPLVDKYDPIDILYLIERDKNISREKISDFIKDFLELKEDNNLDLHRKLYRLSKKIITTNYDKAFEKANPELSKNTAFKGKTYELSRHRKQSASLLFKLHGCYEFVDSMILFPSDYSNFYGNTDTDYSIVTMRNFILNKSILFVGAGMGDFQINNIFQEIKKLQGDYNQKHFIITKDSLDSSLDFLTPLAVSDFAQIEGIVDRLIEIKEHSSNNDTEQVKTLKAQLAFAEEKKKELEALINPDRDKLLEREAWKYFSRGVTFSLEGESENAIKEYEVAIELNPKLYEAYYNLGNALCRKALSSQGSAIDELFEKAFINYENAIKIKDDLYDAYFNLAIFLGHYALTKSEEAATPLYIRGCSIYKKVVKILPDSDLAFWGWGVYLGKLASFQSGKDADRLYEKAFNKYKKAVLLKPNSYEVYFNWGTDLGNWAKHKTGKEAEEIYIDAFGKYGKAILYKSDKHDIYYNWGTDLMHFAKIKEGVQSEQLFDEALDKLQKAVEYGGNPYNLACLHALRSQKEPALQHLKSSLENKKIQPDFVLQDEDWQGYLQDPDFLDLVKHYQS